MKNLCRRIWWFSLMCPVAVTGTKSCANSTKRGRIWHTRNALMIHYLQMKFHLRAESTVGCYIQQERVIARPGELADFAILISADRRNLGTIKVLPWTFLRTRLPSRNNHFKSYSTTRSPWQGLNRMTLCRIKTHSGCAMSLYMSPHLSSVFMAFYKPWDNSLKFNTDMFLGSLGFIC